MEETVGIKLVAQDMASGPLARVQAELRGLGGAAGGIASGGMGLLGRAAGSVEKGLGHLKNTIGGLITGPLGFLGLTAGVLGLGGALKTGVDTSLNLAAAIRTLKGITGESAESLSALIAVAGKYGISSDQIVASAAFATKTIEKLNSTFSAGKDPVSKLEAFQKQYGISLVDSKGHIVDYDTELNRLADYMQTARGKTEGATVAAQLLGRGYAAMIPLLALGSKGFNDARTAAASLGLTLNESNVQDLAKYQETMENLGQSAKGLELQLSLELVPALTNVAQAATHFIADNRQGILAFFSKLITGAETAAGFITGTIVPDIKALAGAAIGFWNSIPAPLRDMLTKFVIADRAMRFLFGFDPVTTIGTLIGKQILGSLAAGLGLVATKAVAGSALSALTQRGSSPLNPLFVTQVGGAGGLGGAAGGAEDVGAAGVAGGFMTASLFATAAAVLIPLAGAWVLANMVGPKTPGEMNTAFSGGSSVTAPLGRGGSGGFRSPADQAASYAAKYGGSTATDPGAMGMRTLPKIAEFSQQSLAAQKIANAFAAQMVQVMQSRFDKIIGITQAEKDEIRRNAQLQAVLDQQNHRLTYAELLHRSHEAHLDAVNTQARIDHLTTAQELTKQAIQAQKMVTNVTVTTSTSISAASIYGSQKVVTKYGAQVRRE